MECREVALPELTQMYQMVYGWCEISSAYCNDIWKAVVLTVIITAKKFCRTEDSIRQTVLGDRFHLVYSSQTNKYMVGK